MIRMFVRHRVANYGSWRKGYDAFDAHRPSFGVTAQAVYQDASDPEMVTVTGVAVLKRTLFVVKFVIVPAVVMSVLLAAAHAFAV